MGAECVPACVCPDDHNTAKHVPWTCKVKYTLLTWCLIGQPKDVLFKTCS